MGCCFDSEGEREQLIVNDSGPTYVPILNQYEFEGADENSSKKLSQELSRRSSTMSSTQESPNQQRKSFERKVVEQEQTESDFAKAIRSPSKEQVIGTTSSMNLNKHNSLATLLNSSKTLPSYSNSAVGVSLSQSFVDNSFPILNTFGNSLRLDYIVTQAQQVLFYSLSFQFVLFHLTFFIRNS